MTISLLISIYPRHWAVIKNRKKNFEFRPWNISSEKTIDLWVYETSPTKALKYKLIVAPAIIELSKTQHYFMSDELFYQYIDEGKYAYEIIGLEYLETPIELKELKKMGVTAPQNFAYLNKYNELQEKLKKAETKKLF
ncbi:hypothetical protein [Brochothrix thermosphacta]|uniref:ASCH domain-containing protein n=1 Tax=Brochothrix thermosphacta TaxID=2756 RepID=A0A2X0S3B9_BROTH|nr:hypothetical protein [Brochothrix thermosphacta]SPP27242.1 conserved hypothetical protein [Brochothrix thermosphacta]